MKTVFASVVVAVGLLLAGVVPGRAETITGTFSYVRTDPSNGSTATRPIAFAEVEIWRCGPAFLGWCTWGGVTKVTTDANGVISAPIPFVGSGAIYAVRVAAVNFGAVVWSDVFHTTGFYKEPGEPGPQIHRTVSMATDTLDFSFTFSDPTIAAHYNIAEVGRRAFSYAIARRDPREGDPMPRINYELTTLSPAPTGTYYDPVRRTVIISPNFTGGSGSVGGFEDFVTLHETGHYLQHHISTFLAFPSSHDGCTASIGSGIYNSAEHAWMEGFADYFAQAVRLSLPAGTFVGAFGNGGTVTGGTSIIATLEAPAACATVGATALDSSVIATVIGETADHPELIGVAAADPLLFAGVVGGAIALAPAHTVTSDMVEDFVAGTLWDLFDMPGDPNGAGGTLGPETFDTLARQDRDVFQIFDHELGALGRWPTILDFHEAWVARGLDAVGIDRIMEAAPMAVPAATLEPARVRNGLEGGQQVTRRPDGRIAIVVRGNFNSLMTESQCPPPAPRPLPSLSGPGVVWSPTPGTLPTFTATCAWTGWDALGVGGMNAEPAAVVLPDGRLQVFYRKGDGSFWIIGQRTDGSWVPPGSLGGVLTSGPAVGVNADGRLEVFARGTDNTLQHIAQNAVNGTWGTWMSLGGDLTSIPVVVRNPSSNTLQVFVRINGSAIATISQSSPGSPQWTSWTSLGGGFTTAPAVAVNFDGRLEVFGRGTDNALWHNAQASAGGSFAGWSSLGGVITSAPAVTRRADNTLDVAAIGTDGGLWHTGQTIPGGGYSGWTTLGTPAAVTIASGPHVEVDASGTPQIFVRATDNTLWVTADGISANWQALSASTLSF
ncbi:MAG: hypothetical protein E6K82_13825 [Candidatus Rokuibacteriota bacterium]|nr:MAG: hypothetical protein E6K82_13825 [Candidatus Rokubacteria bacterium]